MTDKQKLQQLFDAALKSPTDFTGGTPKRAFPIPAMEAAPGRTAPTFTPRVETEMPNPLAEIKDEPAQSEITVQAGLAVTPGVLDDAASTELAALLDEQQRRKSRKHRLEALVTAVVLFGLTSGGLAWFIQSPLRMQAFSEAMRDIRSVGDVKALVGKYQDALNRISTRSRQVDQATAAMGVTANAADAKDANMDAEMKTMMGGEGRTVGDRNRNLQKNFGNAEKQTGHASAATAALKEGESFDLER